MKYKSNSWI